MRKKESTHSRTPLLTLTLLFGTLLPAAAAGQVRAPKRLVAGLSDGGKPAAAAPAPAPQQWPNLDVLTNYPNPSGDTCGVDGAATPGTEKARLNRQKNRYRLPANGVFEPITYEELLALPHGVVNNQGTQIVNYPRSSDPNNRRAVSFVGYVQDVFVAGCRRYSATSGGESCNCNTTNRPLCDAHINVVTDPFNNAGNGRGVVVVEVTERSRRLAAQGLLTTNIGNDWSTTMLRSRLLGRWVRFSGWLFFDADHYDQAWVVDEHNTIQRSNFRETAWEIHPVMGIERVQAPSPFAALTAAGADEAPAATVADPAAPAAGPVTREQLLRRLETLERELRELKEAVRRLP